MQKIHILVLALTFWGINTLAQTPQNTERPWEDDIYTEVIYYEDFSLMTTGSEDAPDMDNLLTDEDTQATPDSLFHSPGWTGFGFYPAGGCIAIHYPDFGGWINTPMGQYAGKLKVRFRVKSLHSDPQKKVLVQTNVAHGTTIYASPVTKEVFIFQITGEQGWVWYEYELENPLNTYDCFVQINSCGTADDGVLVDDFCVLRDPSTLSSPSNLKAVDFTYDGGFTAQWKGIEDATYTLNLYTDDAAGEAVSLTTETFDNLTDQNNLPAGFSASWDNADENHLSADGYEGTTGLILAAEGDTIYTPRTEGLLNEFSLYIKTKTVGNGDYSILAIEGWNGSEWENYCMVNLATRTAGSILSTTYLEQLSADYYTFKGRFFQMRVFVDEWDGEKVVIDQISYATDAAVTKKCVEADIATDEESYTFTSLDPEQEYYFDVTAHKGNSSSQPSAIYHALGLATPRNLESVDVDTEQGTYTARWDAVPKATSYSVNNYGVYTSPEDNDCYVLLHEDFAPVTSTATAENPETLDNVDSYTYLSEYRTNPGWYGIGNTIAEGAVGCEGSQTDYYELYSPELPLGLNDGNCHIKVHVWGEEGDYLIVQNKRSYAEFEFEATGWTDAEFDLSDGHDHDRLMFYTYDGTAFMLSDVLVTTSISKGEQISTTLATEYVEEPACTFSNLKPSDDYCYAFDVQAYYTNSGTRVSSSVSETKNVEFDTTAIPCTIVENPSAPVSFYSIGGVMVSTPQNGQIYIRSDRKKVLH